MISESARAFPRDAKAGTLAAILHIGHIKGTQRAHVYCACSCMAKRWRPVEQVPGWAFLAAADGMHRTYFASILRLGEWTLTRCALLQTLVAEGAEDDDGNR